MTHEHKETGRTPGDPHDYLTKPFSAEELVAAVTNRLQCLEMIRLHNTTSGSREEHAFLRQHVSAREREVLLLVGKGITSKEIAGQLGISLRTVRSTQI